MRILGWRKIVLVVASAALLAAGAVAGARAQAGPTVQMVNYAFLPNTISVPAGTTVTWTNTDPVVHTVTANDASFDSGSLGAGAAFTQTFTTPGTYGYYCLPHGGPGQGMFGTIVVTDAAAAPAPDDGSGDVVSGDGG